MNKTLYLSQLLITPKLGDFNFRAGLFVLLLLLASCATDTTVYLESTNQNSRVNYLVIHSTAENFAESLRLLSTPTDRPVSSHYLLPETGDPSYPHNTLRVYQLVPELRRAWHAGVSYWAGEKALNDRSIGIEVVNVFKCSGIDQPVEDIVLDEMVCEFPPFSDVQIDMLIDLIKSILERFPDIDPIDIVAHSDIAILRKADPGPLFPWKRLFDEGIGAWPNPDLTAGYQARFSDALPSVAAVQRALSALGYKIEISEQADEQTRYALRAFQLHFRAADYTGILDVETAARLWALVEEYRPGALSEFWLM
ncbi:MAG: N-acetylmuramoyl-L-alanine amidase [Gammaproteobacteria bacterium]|nr:N-acetylmuramoyl-L-alanine amidase [Gammaproteobacteria bacterium]